MSKKVILVTGASTGIGKSIAGTLAKKGYKVYAGVRKTEDIDILKNETSDNLMPVILDVTNNQKIQDVFNIIKTDCGNSGLACLINNAGYMYTGPIELATNDEIRKQYDVNVFGLITVIKTFLPLLRLYNDKSSDKGHIINVGSVGGRLAAPFTGIYNSTKAAVAGISDALRVELNTSNIDVTLIEPGSIATPLWQKSDNQIDKVIAEMSDENRRYYEKPLRAMQKTLQKAACRGIAPKKVTDAVIDAIESSNPKHRYLIGNEAKMVAGLVKLLSDRIRHKISLSLIK